jgi:peptidoglycan/xylan/chitin deacetylase (PgdA/CDA1 family)
MRAEYTPFSERRHPYWPDGATMAVPFGVALEEWDADGMIRSRRAPGGTAPLPAEAVRADLSVTSLVDYGFRIGIYRLLEIWREFGLTPTIFGSGLAIRRRPDLFKTMLAHGSSIVGHGMDQSKGMPELPREDQLATIRGVVAIARDVLGSRLVGWSSPATRDTEETLALLASEEFEYHIGLHDDELPYWLRFEDGSRIMELGEPSALPGRQVASLDWRKDADALIAFFDGRSMAAARVPLVVPWALHPHVDGRPERALAIEAVLAWLRNRRDIWLTDHAHLAAWCMTGDR